MIENLKVFSLENFFLSLTSLDKTGNDICSNISFYLAIVKSELLIREFLCLSDLPRTQVLNIFKATKVVVIGQDNDLKFAVLQVIIPSLKDFKNYLEFLVLNFASSFCQNHFLREKAE